MPRPAAWTAQQIVEAFPWDTAPRYLLRDRDGLYGVVFSSRVHSVRIHLSLDKDSPEPRAVQRPDLGRIVKTPLVGGLHHCDNRLTA